VRGVDVVCLSVNGTWSSRENSSRKDVQQTREGKATIEQIVVVVAAVVDVVAVVDND
jgi:VCBS repeat-containing protein